MVWPKIQKNKHELPDICLDGFRVYLRPPALTDYRPWSELRERNQFHLRDFEPEWPKDALSKDFFMRRLARQIKNWERDQGYAFLIFSKQTQAVIGGININNVCRGAAQFASIGYWLDHDHQGEGYMTEALRLVLNHAFGSLRLHRINASCLPHNEKSIALLIRLGFHEEGFAEKYLEIAGKWQDHKLFGMNADRWARKQSRKA